MADQVTLEPLRRETQTQLAKASTTTLTSQLVQRGFRNTFMAGLSPFRPDLRMVGRAFTLRYVPAREDFAQNGYFDNDANVQRLAVEAIGPGDVLVIDARGDLRGGSLGNILATRIMRRGAAGIVTDGAFRDSPAFRRLDLPTYAAAGHAALSSFVHYPVDMGEPIGCAGVLVIPGDVLVGDAEGIVVIPRELADEVATAACEQELNEHYILRKIEEGASIKGLYPPGEEAMAELKAWRKKNEDNGKDASP